MKRLLLAFVAMGILLPGSAYAELANYLVSPPGNPDFVDLSFIYLQDIFGVVDGVLHGTGTQIMGAMFGTFNSAVLTLGFIVMSYVFFVSTINTAHEGEVLGKKWSSIWIPLRIVGSTALIVPKASGYCAIQIFIMSVVVSGIIAADNVMKSALVYIAQGGVLIQSSPPPASGEVQLAGNILKSLTCMDGIYNIVVNDANKNNIAAPSKFVPSSVPETKDNNTSLIYFPSGDAVYNTINYKSFCGNVWWNTPSSTDSSLSSNVVRQAAIQQVVSDLQPYAQSLADSLVPVLPSANTTTMQPLVTSVQDVVSANNVSLVLAAADYHGLMLPYYSQQAEGVQLASKKIIKSTAEQGWIMLGSLYFNLAQLNNNKDGTDDNPPTANFTLDQSNTAGINFLQSAGNLCKLYNNASISLPAPQSSISCLIDDNSLSNVDSKSLTSASAITNIIDKNIALSSANPGAGGLYKAGRVKPPGLDEGSAGGQIASIILNPLIAPIYGIFYNMEALFNAENQNTDPIIAVSGLGSSLVNLVSLIWLGVAGGIFTATLGLGIMPCANPTGTAISNFLIWFVPLFAGLLVALFATGATMAFYVPLIPFILFTFTALGWFAIVIEAMIAAPLVALGLASPEGHEMFGKAEPAILLLANVFLRPSLMVFGFFGGTILSHVGLWLLNKGYGLAWGWSVLSNIGNLVGLGIILALVAGLVIYMSLVLAVINQAFGLIHQLPDELMRWLNGGMKALGSSPSDVLGTTRGEFKGAAVDIDKSARQAGEEKQKAEKANQEKPSKNPIGKATIEDGTGP